MKICRALAETKMKTFSQFLTCHLTRTNLCQTLRWLMII